MTLQKWVFLGILYAFFHVVEAQVPGMSSCQGAANWVVFGDRCYLVYVNQNLAGWDQFEAACRQLAGNVSRSDGHLVAIRSPQEQGTVSQLARPITPASAFIGLRDNTLGQYVTWSDASAVAFASWDAGQPDHYQGRQHCVRLQTDRNGAWDDVECDNGAIRAGICQMSSAVTTG